MLKAQLLGTSGMQPLYKRSLASALIETEKSNILIDAGEGTQTSLRHWGSSIKKIEYILITHLHLDHVGGLPGVMQTIANSGRTEPVIVVGPVGLRSKIKAALTFTAQLPFEVRVIELNPKKIEFLKVGNVEIQPFECQHSIICFGYNVIEKRNHKFLLEKAISVGVKKEDYAKITKGCSVVVNGKYYPASNFLGPERRGLKISYCTDTRPTQNIIESVKGADLLICEGMYPDESYKNKACTKKHMLATEAGELAKEAKVRELWLTHFSPVIVKPDLELGIVKDIFPASTVGYSGLMTELIFDKD